MKKIKILKKKLKKNNFWKKYKKQIQCPKMYLIISKIGLVFNKELDINFLYNIEIIFLQNPQNKTKFLESFLKLTKKINCKSDWKSFALFLWYLYQSFFLFYYKKNIKLNWENMKLYINWMNELDVKIDNLNYKIIQILKLLF